MLYACWRVSTMQTMKDSLRQFLTSLGEDPDREGLLDTPERWIGAMKELTCGYDQTVEEVVGNALFPAEKSEMVVMKDIAFHSLCEHHLLPFLGIIHVGYLPNDKIIGFSKIPRIIEIFTHRLQVQERLGHQIADAIQGAVKPKGVGVVIEASHLCMAMRGVEKEGSKAVTTHMRGSFETDIAVRSEFLSLVSR